MLKQAVRRGFLAMLLAIGISFIVTVIISVAIGDGYYHPVVPAFAEQVGGEINGVVLQVLLAGLQGAVAGAASLIWEVEKWSSAKQTGLYFIALSAVMLPSSYILHWMPRNVGGVLTYIVFFVVFYGIICTVNYIVWKAQIKKMNSKMPRN
ncbi:MAG: DUF3021 domain-containing protein [Defluviitaleaceae bacterium]|nr:DUF3021 domain-containing protein [Defluviitaleaceae bacterium]